MNQTVFVLFFLLVFFFPVIIAMMRFFPKITKIIAFFSFFIGTKPRPGRKLVDRVSPSPEKYTSSQIHRLMQGNYADLGRDTTTGQRFLLDEDARCKNTVVLGPTGAGKSAWLTSTTLASDIMHKGNSVFIFDAMSDFIPKVKSLCREYGRDLLVYPDIGFNPLNLVKTNAQDRARVFNDVLSQVTQVSEEARYYLQRQQLFIRQVLPLFEDVYKKPMILRELWELCLSKERREEFKADAGANPLLRDYMLTVGAWKDQEIDRNLSGLVNFIDTICAGVNVHFYNQRYAPTIEDMIEKKEVCIIREGDDRGAEGHVRGLLYMIAIQEAAKRREEDSHFLALYIDEFHRYLNPAYPPFIATSRKRKIAQVLAFQSLAQLTDDAGRDYAGTIMANARTWAIHTGLSANDAEFIADSIGKRQFVYTAVGENRNNGNLLKARDTNENLGYDYVFYPHEIRNLDQNVSLILSVKERGLDAPRLVEKPKPLEIAKSEYRPPDVRPYAPATVWDEKQPAAAANPNLQNAVDDVLEKARQKNNAKPNRPANRQKRNPAPKKKGEI